MASSASRLLEAALAHHRAGQAPEAERLYRQVLAADPQNVDALHLLGVLASQSGSPGIALRLIGRALELQPSNGVFLGSLGEAHRAIGNLDEAESCYRRAVAAVPQHADAYVNLATLLQERLRYEEAHTLYLHALAMRPESTEVYNNLGSLCRAQRRYSESEAAYRRALELRPAYPEAHNNLGQLLQDLSRDAEAEAAYRQALALRPPYPEAHNNLGALLTKLGRFGEAEAAFQNSLALRPQYPEALNNYGNLLKGLERLDAAEAAFRKALALRPNHPEIFCNLAALLKEQGRYEESESALRQALAIRPDHVEAHYNLGNLLRDFKRHEEADAAYRRALALRPDYPEAAWNLGLLKLALGELREGWQLYEARTQLGNARFSPPDVRFPRWNGEDLARHSVLVWPEQGFGDEIQFARYVPVLKQMGAARITFVCRQPLARLFRTLRGADTVISQSDIGELPPHDYWTYLLSIPKHAGTELDSIPASIPYLSAGAEDLEAWRSRLPTAGLKVGLAWKGRPSSRQAVLNARSLELGSLKPLWSVREVSFVSLQKGPDEDLPPRGDQPMVFLGREIRDFADTAAIILQLDLVICIDTAIAHLAGALGKPCWVLVSRYGSDWRWLLEREDSPWYPRTTRLFRQASPASWAQPIDAITRALGLLTAGKSR